MEIKVTHSVPYDKGYETRCMYNDGDFWGHSVCAHHVYRDRTHGRQAPVERRLPKCALFGVWLDGEYKKCDACLEACKEALGKPMQKPLTLEEMVIEPNAVTSSGREVHFYRCSACGFQWNNKTAVFHYFKFCPNCGARMDAEEDTNGHQND